MKTNYPLISLADAAAPGGVLVNPVLRVPATRFWVMLLLLWRTFHLAPFVYHLASLLLHVANTWLVYGIGMAWPRMRAAAFWGAACPFLINPDGRSLVNASFNTGSFDMSDISASRADKKYIVTSAMVDPVTFDRYARGTRLGWYPNCATSRSTRKTHRCRRTSCPARASAYSSAQSSST